MPVETTTAEAAVLEIERFEFASPDRIEIVGYWTGLRGQRFMRPTLVLEGEGEPKRLLAVLDHKPWAAADGEAWTAAFPWDGEPVKFEAAEMNVGSGIDLELPPPRLTPGKPRRFRQRVVARDASRITDLAPPRARGIVSDAPPKVAKAQRARPKPSADPPATPDPHASKASGATADPPATPDPPATEASGVTADPPATPDPPASKASGATADTPAKAAPPAAPDPDATQQLPEAPAPDPAVEALRGQLEMAEQKAERIRGEREELRRERDHALEKLRGVRADLEAERQGREQAVNDARAAEREDANRMLGEGAELRAAVERQREIAYLERDDAKKARDEAVAARDKACEERDAALADAKEARRERKEAFAQRDRAVKLRERAEATRDQALQEREAAVAEREEAVRARDEVLRAHERGLPVHPPKPRFLPDDHEERSPLDIWGPRASALGVLLLCAVIVLRLFACG